VNANGLAFTSAEAVKLAVPTTTAPNVAAIDLVFKFFILDPLGYFVQFT